MRHIKQALCGLLALLSVGAVASASASAATPCEAGDSGKTYVLCSGGKDLGVGTKLSGALKTGTAALLEGEILGTKIAIECKKAPFTDEITLLSGDAQKTKGEVNFTECVLLSQPNCKVKEPITFKFEDENDNVPAGRIEVHFAPEAPPTFVEITIENAAGKTCLLKGKFTVEGSQDCEVDASNAAAETEAKTHEVICKQAGSALTFAGKPATFTATWVLDQTTKGVFSFRES